MIENEEPQAVPTAEPEPEPKVKQKRGFATLSPERQREIASKGGLAAHANGRAHTWTSAEAREAGRKGSAAGQGKKKVSSP